ncbi:hypothetical protein Tsubulata_026263 [Turnera subulata]|uniref:Uncharacterized protein n=1 Tax=Turnera subulata TaxID=218843 RepID=A0A9Q0FR14_9ROSI|nr:hypothetical protein Tsubulata_026263 [Turnera subulata]
MNRTSYMEGEPDSSLAGASAISGAKPAVEGLGGALLEGNTMGASVGVAELDGMLGDVSGVAAAAGPSEKAGPPTGGSVGAVAGVAVGVMETGDGGEAGEETGGDPLGDGAAEVGGGTAGVVAEGGVAGEILGDNAGDLEGAEVGAGGEEVTEGGVAGEVSGDNAGDLEGGEEVIGDVAGAFAWDVGGEAVALAGGELTGDFPGETVDEEGGCVVGLGGEVVGVGAGALSACTMRVLETHNTTKESTTTSLWCNSILVWV